MNFNQIQISFFKRKDQKFDGPNYQFFQTNSGGCVVFFVFFFEKI